MRTHLDRLDNPELKGRNKTTRSVKAENNQLCYTQQLEKLPNHT